jgi:hypothetical protein
MNHIVRCYETVCSREASDEKGSGTRPSRQKSEVRWEKEVEVGHLHHVRKGEATAKGVSGPGGSLVVAAPGEPGRVAW